MLLKKNILKNKRIAIFDPDPDIVTNPSLKCIIEELSREGASVDIFMPFYGNYPKLDSRYLIYPFPIELSLWKGDLQNTLISLKHFIALKAWSGHAILKKNKYDLLFGINSKGIIAAARYAKTKSVPLIYLSYEIFFKDELVKKSDLLEKKQEILASHLAQSIIIQDKWRAELLSKENRLNSIKFLYLPVAPRLQKITHTSNYLRVKYKIPSDFFIVLHSGSFEDWTYAEELLENAKKWPDNVILVIHTRYKPNRRHKYISIIRRQNSNNIILSIDPLNSIEYERMICSADIGLVFYKLSPLSKYLQKNIETIGLSSGKFSYYAKYGLPIISINQKTYAELLQEYEFGYNLTSFDELPGALLNIISNYEKLSSEAMRLFKEKLAFDIYWPQISQKLLELLD